jgi:hypothetical protein
MAHEVAKSLLEHAGTFVERTEAVEIAISLGMRLQEIEEYLDWLDNSRPLPTPLPGETKPGDTQQPDDTKPGDEATSGGK